MRPQVGQLVNNKYRLLRLIGDGGMGSVYEARHEALGTSVAPKFLHSDLSRRQGLVQRFIQEAKVVARLQSTPVVRVSDVEQTGDGLAFIVMEFIEGKSLQTLYEDLYRQGKRLTYAEALEYAMQMLDGLEAAHAAGIVHRDLKPENVLVVDPAGGEVRVIDWGIAHHPVGPRLTLENLSLGTPTYIAPEQALGRPVDGRADVYALGVIAYEAGVGRPPFASDHALAMVLKHLLEAPPPVRAQRPDVPCCLAALIEAMLAKDPEHRPTAREVRARLAPLQAGAAPVACDHDDALGAYCELVVTDAATEDAPAFEVLPPPATTWQRDPAWAGRRAPRAARAAAIVDV